MAFAMGGYKSLVQNNEESVSSKVEFDKNAPQKMRVYHKPHPIRPVRAKALYIAQYFKAFALTGRQVCIRNYPGRCPGLGTSALSIIFALGKIKR